jgi:hypothetical protein
MDPCSHTLLLFDKDIQNTQWKLKKKKKTASLVNFA